MSENRKLSGATRKFLTLFPVFIILVAAAAVIIAGAMYYNISDRAKSIVNFEKTREQAYRISEQFETGSNTLSYESKMYCETGDFSHFEAYIRELTETRNRDTALQALYRMGLSSREISRMQDAKIASDDLANREIWAMELIALSKGIPESSFPKGTVANILTEAEKKLPAEEQQRLGYQSIMSGSYFRSKSSIDRNVREFTADMMQRYGNSTVQMIRLGTSNSVSSFAIIVVLVLVMVFMLIAYSYTEKLYEKELSAAITEARRASEAKSVFLSNMSHDIRTPMNAIIGMTSMAVRNIDNRERALENLSIVRASSGHLLSLINDVLDLSRIESGKMVFAKEPYTIPDVLREVSAILRPLCTAKSQSFRLHIGNLRHEFVVGDQTRLKQVLVNLLNNANKYTQNGGKIDFYAEETEETVPGESAPEADGRKTAVFSFRVQDNGIGIAADKLEKIFDPFERETVTTLNKVEGTGLGLSIARNIVETRGGRIEVESEKGKGSVFTAFIPIDLEDAERIREKYAFLQNKKILLLKKPDASCADLSAMLEEQGMRSDCTDSTEEAAGLAAAEENGYYAALLGAGPDADVQLGQIRKAAPRLPVLLVLPEGEEAPSGMPDEESANGFILRPVFRCNLYERLMNAGCGSAAVKKTESTLIAGKRILVTEDQEINRMLATMLLEQYGAKAEQAEDGSAAVKMFQNSGPGYYDGILMDVMMPVMGGYEATRKIRAMDRPDAKTVPIIAMTANAFAEDIAKSHEAGMNAHISKPIDPETVRNVLEDAFRNRIRP